MKILIMGLPGSGKTWLAERMQKHLQCAWYNADAVREMANDWDFTIEGRMRQASRMRTLADFESSHNRIVICDFVCPTKQARESFDADATVWLDTTRKSRFEDTNLLFERPTNADYHFIHYLDDRDVISVAEDIIRHG